MSFDWTLVLTTRARLTAVSRSVVPTYGLGLLPVPSRTKFSTSFSQYFLTLHLGRSKRLRAQSLLLFLMLVRSSCFPTLFCPRLSCNGID